MSIVVLTKYIHLFMEIHTKTAMPNIAAALICVSSFCVEHIGLLSI